MNAEQAVALIHEMVAAEIEVVKQENGRGGASRKALARERQAASSLFQALTDYRPTPEQLDSIISY